MTDKEIIEIAKEAEKRTSFGELVHSPLSRGVNSAYGIGFIEGMVEYRNSLQEKHVSEDLEEAAKHYYMPFETFMDGFKKGAKWQKEQMMEKAIDGYVIEDIEEGNGDFLLSTDYLPKSMGLKDQQGVKVIVIKED